MPPSTALVRNSTSPVLDARDGQEKRVPLAGQTLRLHAGADAERGPQQFHGAWLDYRLIEYGEEFYAVPEFIGLVCLANEQQRKSPWIISASDLDSLLAEFCRESHDTRRASGLGARFGDG